MSKTQNDNKMSKTQNDLVNTDSNGKALDLGMDSKKVLKDNAKEGRKVRFNDRMTLEIVKDTRYYTKGQIIEPHVIFAEQLIKDGIAKKTK